MESVEYKITLGLHAMSSPVSLNVNQGETAVRIIATFAEDGVPYQIADGCYAVFAGKKPDGTVLWNKCSIDGDTVIYDFTDQTVAVVGSFTAQVRLYGAGGKLICSPDFTLIVDANTVDDDELVAASQSEVTALTELVTECTVLREMLVEATAKPVISEVTLLADSWVGDESPYSQVVALEGVTEYSQVDLTPSIEQLAIFHDKDLAFVTENDGGVVTVYALGDKPANDYTIQVTITEVST